MSSITFNPFVIDDKVWSISKGRYFESRIQTVLQKGPKKNILLWDNFPSDDFFSSLSSWESPQKNDI